MLFVLKVHEMISLTEYYALVKEYSLQRSKFQISVKLVKLF